MIKLSHSGMNKYVECGFKYKLYYLDNIKEDAAFSALFFGGALDSAFGRLKFPLLTCEIPEGMKWMEKLTAEEVFTEEFEYTELNGKVISLAKSNKTRWYKSDLDFSIINEFDYKLIEQYAIELEMDVDRESAAEFMQECYILIKNGAMDENTSLLFGFINWTSLFRKGLILIESYRENILPTFLKIHSLQKHVEIFDGGDCYHGYIDYEAEFKDQPGVIYTGDDKTSSTKYKDDSVSLSTQLSGYCEATGNYNAAYTVMEKKLRKKDPRTRFQIVRDRIPEETLDLTFDLIGATMEKIKGKVFPKAMDQEGGKKKHCFSYGKMCGYVDFCEKGSMKGLVKMEER